MLRICYNRIANVNWKRCLKSSRNHTLCFSTFSRDDTRREASMLEKFSGGIWNTRNSPLGTLTDEQWMDSIKAIDMWLGLTPRGWAVDGADRLMQRLLLEVAATPQIQRDWNAIELQLELLRAWLELSDNFSKSELAISRAHRVWHDLVKEKIGEHHLSGLRTLGIQLVKSCLRVETPAAIEQALSLLLYDPAIQKLQKSDVESFVAIHVHAHLTLTALPYLSQCNLAEPFLERMQKIHQGQRENRFLHSSVKEERTTLVDARREAAQKTFSTFEAMALRKRFIDTIEKAEPDDRNTIEETLITESSYSEHEDVVAALVDFYIRAGDANVATKWVVRLDSILSDSSVKFPFYARIAELWVNSPDVEAPWRADEAIRRAFNLARECSAVLDEALVGAVANLWVKDESPRAGRHALEILELSPVYSASFLPIAVLAFLKEPNVSARVIQSHFKTIESTWENLPQETRISLVCPVFECLCKAQLTSEILRFSSVLMGNEIDSQHIPVNLVDVVADSPNPDDLIMLLDIFETKGVVLDGHVHEAGIISLAAMDRRTSQQYRRSRKHLLELLRRYFEQLNDLDGLGKDQASAFLGKVLDTLINSRRGQDALEVLDLAEHYLMSKNDDHDNHVSPISLDCFTKVLTFASSTGDMVSVERVFEKIEKYRKHGYPDLTPNAKFLSVYIGALSRNNPSTVELQERLLDELIERYNSSGDLQFKPTKRIFIAILTSRRTITADDNADRAIYLIETMLELEVEISDGYELKAAMSILLQRPTDSTFDNLRFIVEKANAHNVGINLQDVIYGCAFARADQRAQALDLAIDSFTQLRSLGKLNSKVFRRVFATISRFLDKSTKQRNELVRAIFQICCIEGFLDAQVKCEVQSILTEAEWKRLYTEKLHDGEEPPAWSRKCVPTTR